MTTTGIPLMTEIQPSNQEIKNQLDSLYLNTSQADYAIQASVNQVQSGVNNLGRKIDQINRKQRRRLLSTQLALRTNGDVGLIETFDNQDQEFKPISTDLRGNWQVFRLCWGKNQTESGYFVISFQLSGRYIFGQYSKLGEKYLFDLFKKEGITFMENVAESRIKKALYVALAPQITHVESTLNMPRNAGWFSGRFYDASTYPRELQNVLIHLPIYRKKLLFESVLNRDESIYFEEMNSIKNWKERLLITLLPIVGMFSSVLAENNLEFKRILNFILVESVSVRKFMQWLQIFNRFKSTIVDLEVRPREIEKCLGSIKDEVLLMNGIVDPESPKERNRRVKDSLRKITQAVENITPMNGQSDELHFVPVLLSKKRETSPYFINVFVDKTFTKNWNVTEDINRCISGLFSDIVRYSETHYDQTRRLIFKKKSSKGTDAQVLEAAYALINAYWKESGVEFENEMKLPFQWTFDELLEDELMEHDTIEEFIKVVRKTVQHFKITEKRAAGVFQQNTIYYSENHIWFPIPVLRRIMGMYGMVPQMTEILMNLREIKVLITDSDGLSRKLQISGNRFETYQFRRDFFEIRGKASITDLGKAENL